MKRYPWFAAIAIITALAAFVACKKDQKCSIHPDAFRFSIIDSENSIDMLGTGTYKIDEIGIYYFFNNERHDLIVNREANPEGDYAELFSAQLPMISLTGRSDIFYLVLSPEVTDTLLVVVGTEDRGGCEYHPYATVKHNGKDLPVAEGKAFILEK